MLKNAFREKIKHFLSYWKWNEISKNLCSNLKNIYKEWLVVENKDAEINEKYDYLHDRYIIVDKKIQIILTSGIDNLMNIKKILHI